MRNREEEFHSRHEVLLSIQDFMNKEVVRFSNGTCGIVWFWNGQYPNIFPHVIEDKNYSDFDVRHQIFSDVSNNIAPSSAMVEFHYNAVISSPDEPDRLSSKSTRTMIPLSLAKNISRERFQFQELLDSKEEFDEIQDIIEKEELELRETTRMVLLTYLVRFYNFMYDILSNPLSFLCLILIFFGLYIIFSI